MISASFNIIIWCNFCHCLEVYTHSKCSIPVESVSSKFSTYGSIYRWIFKLHTQQSSWFFCYFFGEGFPLCKVCTSEMHFFCLQMWRTEYIQSIYHYGEVVRHRCHLATPQSAPSSSWFTLFTFIFDLWLNFRCCNLYMLWFCWCVLYMWHLLNVFFLPARKIPSWGFFYFSSCHTDFLGENVLHPLEGIKTEDVVHCTDCKAHCGTVICDSWL